MFTDLLSTVATRFYLGIKREDGQTFVEYTLVAALVGVLLIAGLGVFRGDIAGALNSIGGDSRPTTSTATAGARPPPRTCRRIEGSCHDTEPRQRKRPGARRVRTRRARPLPDPVRDPPVRGRVHALGRADRRGACRGIQGGGEPDRSGSVRSGDGRSARSRVQPRLLNAPAGGLREPRRERLGRRRQRHRLGAVPVPVNILGVIVASGYLHSTTTERCSRTARRTPARRSPRPRTATLRAIRASTRRRSSSRPARSSTRSATTSGTTSARARTARWSRPPSRRWVPSRASRRPATSTTSRMRRS